MTKHFRGQTGESYRPSNGTEGDYFEVAWCDRCQRDRAYREAYERNEDADGCPILANALCFLIGEPDYPKEWIYDADGVPACTAFEPVTDTLSDGALGQDGAEGKELHTPTKPLETDRG